MDQLDKLEEEIILELMKKNKMINNILIISLKDMKENHKNIII